MILAAFGTNRCRSLCIGVGPIIGVRGGGSGEGAVTPPPPKFGRSRHLFEQVSAHILLLRLHVCCVRSHSDRVTNSLTESLTDCTTADDHIGVRGGGSFNYSLFLLSAS